MLTPDQSQALDIARGLTSLGIPVFVAEPDPGSSTGYRLPKGWQQLPADPRVVDAWRPGMALAVVMGHGLDLLDVDPRSGGNPAALNGSTPTSYAAAATPSGGVHSFIRSLGIRSRDNVLPGIDVKSGAPDGKGRGFAFIAPTVRVSKVTGQPAPYRWYAAPDLGRLAAVLRGDLVDESGERLVKLIEEARSVTAIPEAEPYTGPPFEQMPEELQQAVRQWVIRAVEGIRSELKASAGWTEGQTDDRGRGWEKLQADAALRLGRLARAVWNDLELGEAESVFLEAAPVDGSWGTDDVALKWRQQHGRLDPAPWPDLRSPSDRDQEAWRNLGVDTAAIPPAQPPGGGDGGQAGDTSEPQPEPWRPPTPAEVASRYFGEGGIQVLTLAADVAQFGPLRTGVDDIMWSYRDGVWRPARHVVRDRLTALMGQRFRTSYVSAVEAILRANAPAITCDPIPELINFTNGLLDWRTGELRPHSPEVASTVQLPVSYDPEAQCPAFEDFVAQVVPEDVVPTIWELIGYLMYSGNPLHKAVMLTGTGRNGKGTFLRALETVLGSRNVTSVSLHDLVNTRFTTASLFGKLANIAGDIDATYLENTATFKGITGGDTISAEHKGRDRFDFKPWAVPVFSANKIPASADTSVGYLSRWLVIPFPNDFTGREDRHLDARLHRPEELAGIVARGVRALGGLLDRGDFMLTASGEAAREEFIRRVDQVRTWLAECCDIALEHPWVARTELYQSYKQWAFRDGHKPVRASEFYERLEQAGAEPAIIMGTRGFKRIKVQDHGHAPVATGPWGSNAPQVTVTEPAPAPTTAAEETAGQPESFHNPGAEGADTPHPPYARDAQEKGLDRPAPSAPKSKRGSAAASEKAAQQRAEKRAAAIAEAAGETVQLPALVTRDGKVAAADLETLDHLLGTITANGQALTVDVETTGYPIGHADYALRTIQLGNQHFAVVLDAGDLEHQDVARRHLASARVLHAHSATADLIPLAHAGLADEEQLWAKMVDTAILAKLADPSSTDNSADLKNLSKAVLGKAALSPAADAERAALFKAGKWLTDTEVTTPLERSGWAQVDSACTTMVRYAASDVLDDAALAVRLPQPTPDVLARERTAQRMTARMASTGFRFDAEQIERLVTEHTEARTRHAEQVHAFGVDNPGSNPQVGEAFGRIGTALPTTATGKPSVAGAVLEPMRTLEGPAGDLARAVLDYRHHDTALKLLLEPWRELVRRGDGRARSTIYTLGADTGRMSSVRFNFQQVSREGGLRGCITADPGHLLASADFAGVELRVAGALSGDQQLIAILNDPDRDLHWEVARLAFGPGATKANRYAVKRGVFGRIYGGGVKAVAAGVGVSMPVAQQVIDAMDALTPQLAEWSRMVRDGIESGRTQFRTYSGRVIHLPKAAPHAGPNYCIQGTARELLVDALLRWRETRWGEATLLPVHDELVVMVPEDEAEAATAELEHVMTSELFGVPIKAEASTPSFAWADSV